MIKLFAHYRQNARGRKIEWCELFSVSHSFYEFKILHAEDLVTFDKLITDSHHLLKEKRIFFPSLEKINKKKINKIKKFSENSASSPNILFIITHPDWLKKIMSMVMLDEIILICHEGDFEVEGEELSCDCPKCLSRIARPLTN